MENQEDYSDEYVAYATLFFLLILISCFEPQYVFIFTTLEMKHVVASVFLFSIQSLLFEYILDMFDDLLIIISPPKFLHSFIVL